MEAPAQGEDCRLLWRYVRDLVDQTNGLINMSGEFEGKVTGRSGSGILRLTGQTAELRLNVLGGIIDAGGPVKLHTALTLVSNANPADYGVSPHYTATVAVDATGVILFYKDWNIQFASITLVNGVAVSPDVAGLQPGDHVMVAFYPGDDRYLQAIQFLTQTINAIPPPDVFLESNNNPSNYGEELIFHADVRGIANIPPAPPITGIVSFYIDDVFYRNANLGTVQVSANTYRAIAPGTSTLPEGFHTIKAWYRGDPNYGNVHSEPFTQRVLPAPIPTYMQVYSSENPLDAAHNVYWYAILTPGASGNVNFYVGDPGVLFSVNPIGPGGYVQSATDTPGSGVLHLGNNLITAYFPGDLVYAPAGSQLTQVVTNLTPVEVFVHCSDPSNVVLHGDQRIYFYATVTGPNPIPPAPGITGSVQFSTPTGVWQTIALTFVSGTTWHAITPLVGDDWPNLFFIGNNQVTAKYLGDPNYSEGVDSLTLDVTELEPPALEILSSQEPIGYGEDVNWQCIVETFDTIPPAPDFDGEIRWLIDGAGFEVDDVFFDTIDQQWTTGGTAVKNTLLPGEHVIDALYRLDSYPERNGVRTNFTQHILPVETSYTMSNQGQITLTGGMGQVFGLNRNHPPNEVSRTLVNIPVFINPAWAIPALVLAGPCSWAFGAPIPNPGPPWLPGDPTAAPTLANFIMSMLGIPSAIRNTTQSVTFSARLGIQDVLTGDFATEIDGPWATGGNYIDYIWGPIAVFIPP